MSQLVPCGSCQRHVRAEEADCPFCGVAIEVRHGVAAARPGVRLSRAAMFAFGAALSTAAGCADSHDPDDGGATHDAGVVGDAGAGFDAGNVAPPYGLPPSDAGGIAPLYGGSPED